jgi:hypothetical protein
MSTKELSQMTDYQAKVAKNMSPELLEVAQRVDALVKMAQKGTILAFYDVGTKLRQVSEDQTNENGLELIGQYLGYTEKTQYRMLIYWRDLAVTWDRETLKSEMEQRMANGQALSLQHFLSLTAVSDPARRQKLLDDTRKKNWSSQMLHLEITGNKSRGGKGKGNSKGHSSGGKTQDVPESPAAAFQKGFATANRLANYLELLPEAVFDPLLELDDSEFTVPIGERLNEFDEALDLAQQEIASVRELLGPVKEKAARALSGESEGEVVDETEADSVPVGPTKAKGKARGKGKTGSAKPGSAKPGSTKPRSRKAKK